MKLAPSSDLNFPTECVSICRVEMRAEFHDAVCRFVIVVVIAVSLAACTGYQPHQAKAPAIIDDSKHEAININTAPREELQRLPFIGERLAAEIVEHRERFGQFRRPEEMLLLNGISDKRFREIRHLVRVD